MGYVAGKRMDVKTASGEYETRQAGEPVPEAATWKNLDTWVRTGQIKLVPDAAVANSKPAGDTQKKAAKKT